MSKKWLNSTSRGPRRNSVCVSSAILFGLFVAPLHTIFWLSFYCFSSSLDNK
jgi:hypothetical protein